MIQKISKSHDAIKKVKDVMKTSTYPTLTVSDDLQVLSLVDQYDLTIDTLLYSYEREYHENTYDLLERLKTKANQVYEISNQTYDSLSLKENHAGILAIIEFRPYTFDDFKDKEFLLVLDHLEIPGNVGTIYRTLDSISADGIFLVDPISKINNPKITSSSRGCNLTIPTINTTYLDTLSWLLENNYTIFLGEPTLGKNYQAYTYQGKIAIVVGNERYGIQEDWYNHPHEKVFIPMEGSQNSLNVGVAASILAYEAYMKRKKGKKKTI